MKKQIVHTGLSIAVLAGLLMGFGVQAGVTTDTISIKFAANEPSPDGSELDPTAVAGVPGVESANWNNAFNEAGTVNNLVRDTFGVPTATAASVTYATTNTWRSGSNNHFVGDNNTLMKGYLDENDTPLLIRIGISNLPDDMAAGYDVYVYFLGDAVHRGGVYTVNRVAKFGFVTADVTGPDFVDAGLVVPPAVGNYLVFQGLSGATISITADNDIDNRAPINAVEVVSAAKK